MLIELATFAGKFFIVFLFITALVMLIAFLITKAQHQQELEVESLSEKFKSTQDFLHSFGLSKAEIKAEQKKRKAEEKAKAKLEKQNKIKDQNQEHKKQLYVLKFHGDVKASQTEALCEEVNAILQGAKPGDEVLCCIESPGGVVNGYGLASSQLLRIRQAGLNLTVAIDQVAASGGYLMSCVANQILAAPFAIVGSIGVVAQVPNFNKVLKKWDVDFKEYTAGEFKRTVSILGEITPKGEEKFVQQLEETHSLFKNYVQQFRPQLNLSQVATGEYWYGEQAIKIGLIDRVQTSDEFLLQKNKEDYNILQIRFKKTKNLQEKISEILGQSIEKAGLRFLTQNERQKFF